MAEKGVEEQVLAMERLQKIRHFLDNEKKRKYNNNVTRFNNYVTFRPIDNTTAIGTRFFCFSNICGNHKI